MSAPLSPPAELHVLMTRLSELAGRHDALERENANLRRQLAWFQRQIFGQKSERRLPEPEGVQGTLGEAFTAVPDTPSSSGKRHVAAHERSTARRPNDGADESALFFDDTKVPVEVIHVPNPETEGAIQRITKSSATKSATGWRSVRAAM